MRPLSPRRTRRATRPGFSLIELLIVFVIFGLVVAIGVPRFNYMRETSQMRSAKAQIGSIVATGRAAAIRRATTVEVKRDGNLMVVLGQSAATGLWTDTIVRPVRLNNQYGVTLATASPTSIRFDARGMASPILGSTGIFVFTRSTYRDSVCVSRVGAVMRGGCL